MKIATPFLVLLSLAAALRAESLTNSLGMQLVPIAPGSFTMGQDGPAADYRVVKHAEKFDDADWDERPAHRVKIRQTDRKRKPSRPFDWGGFASCSGGL